MDPKDARTAVTLTPQYFEYGATSARYSGSGQKSVSVVIQIANDQPTKPEDVGKAGSAMVFRHNLGRLDIGKVYSDTVTKKKSSTERLRGRKYQIPSPIPDRTLRR
jgi:hypothetical protein